MIPAQRTRTYLGFDHGMRRIGVAVGQDLTRTARPLQTLGAVDGVPDWKALSVLITQWQPDGLVVGIPYRLDGSAQEMTRAAQRFARRLHGRFRVPVHFMDERLSSAEAQSLLGGSGPARSRRPDGELDQVAAQLILQSWLQTGEHR